MTEINIGTYAVANIKDVGDNCYLEIKLTDGTIAYDSFIDDGIEFISEKDAIRYCKTNYNDTINRSKLLLINSVIRCLKIDRNVSYQFVNGKVYFNYDNNIDILVQFYHSFRSVLSLLNKSKDERINWMKNEIEKVYEF